MKRELQHRQKHPIEAAILSHVKRYGLTTPEAALHSNVRGMTSVAEGKCRLDALASCGELHRFTTRTGRLLYLTHWNSSVNVTEAQQDESQRLMRARGLQRLFGCLMFCCGPNEQRIKLTGDDMKLAFPDLAGIRKRSLVFYLVESKGSKRLGVINTDTSSDGKWDRSAIRFAQELHRLQRSDCIQKLARGNAFEATLITALQPKANRIARMMNSLSNTLSVPVRCVANPTLLEIATLSAS